MVTTEALLRPIREGIPSYALVVAQIAVGLIFLDVALKKQARGIEQGAPAD